MTGKPIAKSSEHTEKKAKTAAVKIRCPRDRFGRYATNVNNQVRIITNNFPRLQAPITPKSIAPMLAVATVLKIKSGKAIEPMKKPIPFKSPSSGLMSCKRTEKRPVKMASMVTKRALNKRTVGLELDSMAKVDVQKLCSKDDPYMIQHCHIKCYINYMICNM